MGHYRQALWLEWSGLPAQLNQLRANGWLVFKKLIELDCETNAQPDGIQVALEELQVRCGLPAEKIEKVIEALRKAKFLRCYLPDHPAEPGLFEICLPIQTPLSAQEVASQCPDPHLRDKSLYRYANAHQNQQDEAAMSKAQQVADWYMDHLSQGINSITLDQIQLAARRFPLEDIRSMIERAARHNIPSMSWVLKELIRAEYKGKDKSTNKF